MNKTVILTVLHFLLAWVCFRDKASAAMLQRPMNLVVRSGESIEMSCRWDNVSTSHGYPNIIEWYHTPVGSSSERKINDENQVVNTIFNGSTLNGEIIGQKLKVMSAQKQHAGLYTCTSMVKDNNGLMTIESAAAQVVVLAADPVCQMRSGAIQIEGHGAFEVCCMLSYTGSLVPVMKWRMANGNKSKERALNITPAISETSAVSTLTIVADFSLNGSRFIHETVFEVSSTMLNPKVANNTPNYNYNWTSSYIQVQYGPRNLRVIPAGDVFYPDDNLTCMADGNPKPEVLWLDLETKVVTRGPTVIIKEEMIRDQPYQFLCRATNPATNQIKEVPTGFTVKRYQFDTKCVCLAERCMSSDSTILKILLVVTLAVSALIIASLSVYIAITKRKRRGNSRAVPIAAGRECDAVNPKTPLSRVSRYNLSLPLPTVKHHPLDYTDYLSPRPLSSVDYDEIPYAPGVTAQNVVYLEIAPEPSNQPASVPFEFSRPVNEYLAAADLEVAAKPKVYEALQPREK